MSNRRGEIFLGDLIAAREALGADSVGLGRLMARQLGLFGMVLPSSGGTPGAYAHDNAPGRHFSQPTQGVTSTVPPQPPGRVPGERKSAVTGPPLPIDVSVRPSPGHSTERPDWLVASAPLPIRDPARSSCPHQPIFPRNQTRGIVSAGVSVRRQEGPLDVERLVDRMAYRRPLSRLPRLPMPTLRNGCQLLLDRGEAMAPFADDVNEFEAAIGRIVGAERTKSLDFIGSPVRGTRLHHGRIVGRWLPPLPGTPLVLLTDLGIGGPSISRERADLDEWHLFAEQARGARCPIVAFIPFAPSRWPVSLPNNLVKVHWDRRTTAGTLRRVIGPGHRFDP